MKYQADVPNIIAPNTAWLLRKSVVYALGVSNNNNNNTPAAYNGYGIMSKFSSYLLHLSDIVAHLSACNT